MTEGVEHPMTHLADDGEVISRGREDGELRHAVEARTSHLERRAQIRKRVLGLPTRVSGADDLTFLIPGDLPGDKYNVSKTDRLRVAERRVHAERLNAHTAPSRQNA